MLRIIQAFTVAFVATLAAIPASAEGVEWLVCGAPYQVWPALDRANLGDPNQLLNTDPAVLAPGCLYSDLSEYSQKNIQAYWSYYRSPLIFEISRVTVVEPAGTISQFFAITNVINEGELVGGIPPFVVQRGKRPKGAEGAFVPRFLPVMKQPPWDAPGS